MNTEQTTQAARTLRQELARGDVALAGVAPVLSHLLASPGQSLVSEDILARMRGMLGDLAHQFITAEHAAGGNTPSAAPERAQELSSRLASSSILVSHVYAIAMENQLSERLEQNAAIDQVLTPLMQELIASDDDAVAELAMATMSAQARFVQAQRRMDLPLSELPAELFLDTIACWRESTKDVEEEVLGRVEQALRSEFDESNSRLGLLTRLVGSLAGGIRAALDLEHAGVALFVTALARKSRQARELAILSCHERQAVRFALALRGVGLKHEEMVQQFLLVHRNLSLPDSVIDIAPDAALTLLKGTAAGRVD